MKAITASGKIDQSGQLSLDDPIQETLPKRVRVIIVFEETEEEANQLWGEIGEYQAIPIIPSQQLQQELKQDLTESGYDSREKIIQLVQDVKQEIYKERQDKLF
ncbi:hypothetical protein PJF56_16215 [Roseofilum sp. BLCC_M91]|uniref:Uncharacterized protein n=1 Tax=Roseofilum halophilum BLCC-M91 TaxID=3022259 RepID=A0ABT7BMI4_9CYAN|nr:hypothetical protein [Roseofilum halophilum]MDJ1180408.1 hypothetical protein [Roseofilum halophilum BLCC-M91]